MSYNLVETVKVMASLTRSTARYVHKNIQSHSGKEAYKIAMLACLEILDSDLRSLDLIRQKIEGVREDMDQYFKSTLFNSKKSEQYYYNLACTQTLEVMASIEGRFITGMQDGYARKYKGGSVYEYEDEGIF